MKVDYLIVGSGLTGATLARLLTDAGKEVLVVDRRAHLGGNVFDHHHESGIRMHTYGPHYFRTSSDKIWRFVNRFGSFYKYEGVIQSVVDGNFERWPVNKSYIKKTVGANWKPEFVGTPRNFEEASLSLMPRAVYEKFVKGYTEKQWGVPAKTLAPSLARRIDINEDDDPRLKNHKYQGIPNAGYAGFMQSLLSGIPVLLNVDYLKHRSEFAANKRTIFTGPIDEYFGFKLGRLLYRGQKRTHEYLPDTTFALPCGQVNFPDPKSGDKIRTLEWKHMLPKEFQEKITGTVLTTETPITPTCPEEYEYPFPDEANQVLFKRYEEMAKREKNLLICGRLGEYRYYDMDQAIARAFVLAERVILNVDETNLAESAEQEAA